MQCKNCHAALEDGTAVCPNCGEPTQPAAEEGIGKKLLIWKIVMASLTVIVLLVVLIGAVRYGTTGSILPKKNDIYCKDSYTVSDEKLNTSAGSKSFEKDMDQVIATMGSHSLTNRQFQLYYWQEVRGSSYADMDSSQPLDQQFQDPDTGKTWEQFFIEEALKAWQQDMLLLEQAESAGFRMPEKYAAQFETLEADMAKMASENGYTSADAMLQKSMGKGCTFQAYREYMWNFYYGALYWSDRMKTLEVSDAELENYFLRYESALKTSYEMEITKDSGKLVDVRHILIMPEGGTKSEDGKTTIYSDAEWEACREKAQKILDQWLAGEKTEESFSALATANSEDPGSKSSGGLYTYVYKGRMVQEFEDWCFDDSRQTGDYGLVKTSYGYHIMYYVFGEEGWIRVCRNGVQSEKAQTMLDELITAGEMKVNYKNIVLAEADL